MKDRAKGELNLVNRIMAYECGELDDYETVRLFRDLVRTGMVWQLQGHYQRMAYRLHEAGLLKLPARG